MPAEDDILAHLDPAVRQRIEADRSRFEPFLGLLSAWKAAVDEHLSRVEHNVSGRLAEEFFPQGDWRFPAQTIAVPDDLRDREVSSEMPFTDPLTGSTWTPCGPGWTLPSEIARWTLERGPQDQYALLCDVRYEDPSPDSPPITAERGQIAFVHGSEVLVAALADAEWAVQYPEGPLQPIAADRYQGYLAFEQEMGVAEGVQRHLEAWLPPCHPYSRKFLHLHPRSTSPEQPEAGQWQWLDEVAPFEPPQDEPTLRLAAMVNEATADALESRADESPLILNAIPLGQMSVLLQPIVDTLHAVGDAYKVTFSRCSNFFAAAARAGGVVHQARFVRTPVRDPRRASRAGQEAWSVDVTCDQTATEVKVYHQCLGEESNPGRDRPERLTRPMGQRFSVPLPALGAMNVMSAAEGAVGARRHWYHNLLRPRLLTEGDVRQILADLPVCRDYFDLEQTAIQLDVLSEPWVQRTPWDTYLWPSIVSEQSLLELRTSYLTATRVPIVPVLRLHLQPRRHDVAAFLLEDLARYAASFLSRYFMVGWYRIEGRVVESS